MTAVSEPAPKIVIAVGAPDGMSRAEATTRYAENRLHGISGISRALLPWLEQTGHPFSVVLFGSAGALGDDAARRIAEQTAGRVLVNLVCEPLTQGIALEQIARMQLATRIPVINPSTAVLATTRPAVARRLAHQTGVRVPHCSLFMPGPLTLVEHIAAHGHRYPVLLRPPGGHGSVGLVRADDAADAGRQAWRLPACTITDFVDFRSEDGVWRKYRMVLAGERLFRRHVLMGPDWNITREVRPFMRERPELVAEERAWIERPVTLERGSVEARIMHQFRALQLDFGVIDFALPPGGDVVVFEINACVELTNPTDGEAAATPRYFEANNDEILTTLAAAIRARAGAR